MSSVRLKIIEKKIELRECMAKEHSSTSSVYPREKVPLEFFLKNDIKRNKDKSDITEYYKYCIVCREYFRNYRKNLKDRKISYIEETEEFKTCLHINHETYSEFPRNRVPKNMFVNIRTTNNNQGKYTKNCLDCRNFLNEKAQRNKKENRDTFKCAVCGTKDISLRGKN